LIEVPDGLLESDQQVEDGEGLLWGSVFRDEGTRFVHGAFPCKQVHRRLVAVRRGAEKRSK